MTPTIPATSGIYRITCTVTGRIYIGSAINLQKRWREHQHHLLHKTHHSITLQRAWDKHTSEAFTFEVLELVLSPFLLEREQHWLDTLLPFDENGYNINRIAGSRFGMTHTAETREKLRQANLGKKHNEETIRKLTESSTGKTHSAEVKERIRQIRIGTKRDQESRERSRISHLGKKDSPETIERKRLALTGRPVSDESRAKLSASNVTGNEWRMKTLIVTSPDGTVYTAHGIGQFCREHSLNRSALIQVAKGKTPHHKGWTAHYA